MGFIFANTIFLFLKEIRMLFIYNYYITNVKFTEYF